MKQRYDRFIFFSAGPVGDHALLLDHANRFSESSGIPSTLIYKHYSKFLADITIPYPQITNINWQSLSGKLSLIWLIASSLWRRNCFVLVLPLKHPAYIKLLAYYIRFCTRSRMIGFNLVGSVSFKEKGSAYFLGEKNIIPAHVDTELFYEQANRMLAWLGYKPVDRVPNLKYIEDKNILPKYGLAERRYLCMHLAASHVDRSLPADRWNAIIGEVRAKMPDVKIVFTGAKADETFINACLEGLPRENLLILCGVTMQEMLNIYAKAKLTVCVHTGNAIIVNMLHVPTVMVAIKGVYMFNYKFNSRATILTATEGCTCDPYERNCSMVAYKGNEYMACLFNIPNRDIITAILTRYDYV